KRQQKQKEEERAASQRAATYLKSQAEQDTQAAQQQVDAFRTILASAISTKLFVDWDAFLDRRPLPPFRFQHPVPNWDELCHRLLGPEPQPTVVPQPRIMEIKRDDDRFVESKDVLNELNPEDNLAAMDWENFEHLIRELFEQVFKKSGGEVRVTQASRDRGVDAIAFDPDLIRGGKFVIQAKRYNMVVPVSAVRDLYGTMIAEGATKGILVTTSHFGRDSREFAKDKPITLIDGANLVHLFQEHGHNLHIELLPKGDPRRGLGATPRS